MRKAALFVTRKEAAIKDANKLRGKWSFWSCMSGHISLFHPRTWVGRSQRPFQSPPSSCSFEDRELSQTLLLILERRPWLHPIRFRGRGGFLPSLHFSPTSFPAGRGLLHPLSGQKRFLHQPRSESPLPQGGHRGGPALASASQLYQLHLSRPKEEWQDATHFELEKVERGAPQHPILPDGDGRRLPPHPQTKGLGGVHRPTRHLLSSSSP
jgi:hypothetical protein